MGVPAHGERTLTGLRLASSAAVAGNAAATGTWPAWENAVISSSLVSWSRGRLLVTARPHPKFRPTASAEPQDAADVRHANQVGALLPAPIRSHQLSPASESRPTRALPLAPSPRPTPQGSGAALGSSRSLCPHRDQTAVRGASSGLAQNLHKLLNTTKHPVAEKPVSSY